ncbi:MAG: annexin [Firmicutes bacterium]|nr:annexin [Bacillota bacterium]
MDSVTNRNINQVQSAKPQNLQQAQSKPAVVQSKPAQETKQQEFGKVGDLQNQPPGEANPKKALAATGAQSNSAKQISGSTQENKQNQQAQQKQQPYNPQRDTTELYRSMHGGLTGMGTDEKALFKALDGKNPEQLNQLRQTYKDHYKRDLDADIRSELSGDDLKRAESLLGGNQDKADANSLRSAMSGAGTDEQAIFSKLQGKSKEQIDAIKTQYRETYGKSLDDDLKGDLSGDDLKKAQALLSGDNNKADAATLHNAMSGMGTDEASIYKTLEGKDAKTRAAIQDAYKQEYGRDLNADFKGEMKGAELDRANALMEGNGAKADAAKMRDAMSGMGTDENAIWQSLEGKSAEERKAIADEYKKTYGRELRDDFKNEMSGNDLKRSETLLDKGKLSDAEKLRYAMAGAGTDEDTIRDVLKGRSKEEIAQIKSDYQQQFGRDLTNDLKGDLSGRDEFDAMQDLKGKPQSAEEALQRMNETRDYERKGVLNHVSRNFVDTFSDKGQLLDDNTKRANEFYKGAMQDGKLDEGEKKRLSELTGYVNDDVQTYREAKDSAAETAGTVAATAASVAVVVGTAGTATPAVVALGAAATAGAGARVMTKAAIGGKGYGWEEGAIDMGIGAVDGASTVVGGKAGTMAARATLEATAESTLRKAGADTTSRLVTMASGDILERNAAKRVMIGAVEGAVDGSAGGGMSGAGASVIRDGTWDHGFGEGLKRVGTETAMGVGVGAAAGGVISGGMSARAGGGSHLVDDSKVWITNNHENNFGRNYGHMEDMIEVNKALEPNPPSFKYKISTGEEVDLKIYGSTNKQQIENIHQSVNDLAAKGGDRAILNLREIHIRNKVGQFTNEAGVPIPHSEVGGLGGSNYGEMVIQAESASTRSGADHVVHHEVGHNIDANMGIGHHWVSDAVDTPFGKGASVSAYGSKNAAEDFAETHRELISNWDKIQADPDRYLHYNGDVGNKYKWMLENVYEKEIKPPTPPQEYARRVFAENNPAGAAGGTNSMFGGMGGMTGGGGMGGGMLGGINSMPPEKIAEFLRTPEGNKMLTNFSPLLKDAGPEQLEQAIEQLSRNPGMLGGAGAFGGGMTGGGMMGGFGGAGNSGGSMGGGMLGGPPNMGFKPLRPQ